VHVLASLLLLIIALPAAGASLYLLILTLLSARLPPLAPSSRQMRFDIIVPAHNEVEVLDRVLTGLQRLDWPQDRY
jgi:cellulose synthase/poly-beta-1,6-N-acetylglucosamine synthase-like glycosyltransferase